MITIVYASMNRETNLIESLKSWIDTEQITEFIVVDWSSKNSLLHCKEMWNLFRNSKKKYRLIRVEDKEYFSISKAYNLGFEYTENNLVLKLDCDYKNLDSSWLQYLPIKNQSLNQCFISGDYRYMEKSLCGILLINKKDFIGYNENLHDWGYDDIDLYNRLKANKITQLIFFLANKYIQHIDHSDEDRTKNYKEKNIELSNHKNMQVSSNTIKSITFTKYITLESTDEYSILKEEI
jgi:hypothetical protein